MSVNINHKAEVSWQIPADLMPVLAGIVGAQHVPVLLHEERVGTRAMQGDAVNAVTHFGILIRNVLRPKPTVDRLPCLAAVVGTESAGSGNGDEHPLRIAGIDKNRVQAHSAGARLPLGPGAVTAQAGELFPAMRAIV